MFKSFLSSVNGGTEGSDHAPDAPLRAAYIERIRQLVDYFPLGKKLCYIPEFKKEIVFETLLVAYCIDGEYIYSLESIEHDAAGVPIAFFVGANAQPVPLERVRNFQVLLPNTSDQEQKLDYQRRALIGRGRQFNKGNCISLISSGGRRGVVSMDTEVVKRVVLHEGPYANVEMVLVEPELKSIIVTDQRGKSRTDIRVPMTMTVADAQLQWACTIVDVSDDALRIRLHDGETMTQMGKGEEVVLAFDLSGTEYIYAIKGIVIRRSPQAAVIKLEAFSKGGEHFAAYGPLDRLELKALLINYGKLGCINGK